ncbi:pentapeptide repeat-containing protein [Paraburkholderia sediminicola]|uniref:pentapeptide repeat-containing protein n=1 Tax=Paraburkholderia sediminicola TaxID=458836 RepID=UPI0038BB2385
MQNKSEQRCCLEDNGRTYIITKKSDSQYSVARDKDGLFTWDLFVEALCRGFRQSTAHKLELLINNKTLCSSDVKRLDNNRKVGEFVRLFGQMRCFDEAKLSVLPHENLDWRGKSLRRADARYTDLSKTNLEGVDIQGTYFVHTKVGPATHLDRALNPPTDYDGMVDEGGGRAYVDRALNPPTDYDGMVDEGGGQSIPGSQVLVLEEDERSSSTD